MKRNLLALSAVVMAIAFSSFTSAKFATVYFLYNGGTEKVQSNYETTASTQIEITGNTNLAWFKGVAVDPTDVDPSEFNSSFEAIDGDLGGSDNDLLSDESEDHINMEKQ
jgi:hypothetical protein